MKQPKMSEVKINKRKTKSTREAMKKSKKVRITINFDSDILSEVKDMADDIGTPYQTLLNKIVKDALLEKNIKESRLEKLEKEVEKLKKKIAS